MSDMLKYETSTGIRVVGESNRLPVDTGAGFESLGKIEDSAHLSGDVGIMALGVRKDAGGTLAGTDGDYVPPQMDAAGNVRVNLATAIPAGANNIGNVDVVSPSGIGDGIKTIAVAGAPAALVIVSTPCKAIAITALPTNVGNVAVGAATVDVATNRGVVIAPGGAMTFDIDNVQKVYLDVATGGDGVGFLYLT